MDSEKAFDSLDHDFLSSVWIGQKVYHKDTNLLKGQLSCAIKIGTTTQYFNLRGTRQVDSISACLFILMLENLYLLIKKTSQDKRYRNI